MGWEIGLYPEGTNTELKERIDAVENNEIQKPYDPRHPFEVGIHSTKYSRILIAEGKIIGWLVANQISTDLLRYAKAWVDPGWEKSGGLLAMVADVMTGSFCWHRFTKYKSTCCSTNCEGLFCLSSRSH